MDTDTLIEKFIRSEEALNRLGDDIKQLVFTRAQELRESKTYLETLIKEKEAVDAQLTEQEARIASYQEEINNQANLKEELVRKQNNSAQEAQKKEIQAEELINERKMLNEKLQTVNSAIQQLKSDITRRREKMSEVIKSSQELELKFKTELEEKESEKKQFEEQIRTLEAGNPVISFLLEESAEDIPEVDILAAVMKLDKTNKDLLKEELDGILSPVIITRTLGRMAEKNIINYDESRDIITPR